MRKILLIIGGILVLIAISVSPANADAPELPIATDCSSTCTPPYQIVVDGTPYLPLKLTGSAVHYDTPDTNPTTAYTERNTWTGHGQENLPCEGGIHWIDNPNVLTISHCLGTDSTTTTTTPVTTTTVPPTVTTTTVVTPTSTTIPVTTTTVSQPELPDTGFKLRVFGYVGIFFTAFGVTLLLGLRRW